MKFRWRLIPVTLLYFFGLAALVGAAAQAAFMLYGNLVYGPPPSASDTPALNRLALTFTNVGVLILAVCQGTVSLFAGRAYLKGRWRLAAIGTAVVVALGVVVGIVDSR